MGCAKCSRVLAPDAWPCVDFNDNDPEATNGIPNKSGVYVIRVRDGRRTPKKNRQKIESCLQSLENLWPEGGRLLRRKLDILEGIDKSPQCEILYIGQSKNLRARFRALHAGHTIWPALWTLLYQGWKLRFCWKEFDYPVEAEANLRKVFSQKHGDDPDRPALNTR